MMSALGRALAVVALLSQLRRRGLEDLFHKVGGTAVKSSDMRVLHVSEAFGGGVEACIYDYCAATPNVEHHLLRRRRTRDLIGTDDTPYRSTMEMVDGHVARLRQLAGRIEAISPDVIHLHSSYAGAYGRMIPGQGAPVVYTPHAYPFQRLDVSPWARLAYIGLEGVLARRTTVVAAVSQREGEIARRLASQALITVVNQRVVPSGDLKTQMPRQLLVTGMGRLVEQKGYRYYLDLVERCASLNLPITWQWIGGGEASRIDEMQQRGVQVTGWLPRKGASAALSTADLYVHCASWDGSPLAVFEAAGHGLPVLARRIDALRGVPIAQFDSIDEMTSGLVRSCSQAGYQQMAHHTQNLRERYTAVAQREALLGAYELAINGDKRVAS